MNGARLSSSRAVIQSGVFNAAGYMASVGYMVLLVPIAVHFLGVDQFALWSITLALTGYFGLADFGLSTSFVKYISAFEASGDREGTRRVILHGLLFYTVLCAVIVIAGSLSFPWLFALVGLPAGAYQSTHDAFILSLIGFGFTSAGGVYGSALLGIQRAEVYNGIIAAGLVVKLGAITAVLAAGYGLTAMFAVDAAVNGALIAPLILGVRRLLPGTRILPFRYDGSLMRSLLRFGMQLQVSRLAEVVQAQFDKLLLPRFAGLSSVSLYDFGSRPLGRLRALPLAAMSALVPAVAALDVAENRDRVRAALLRATRYVIVAGLPLFLLVASFADPVIHLWLGTPYGRSALTLQILSAAFFVNVAAAPLSFVAQGLGQLKEQVRATLVQVILNCVLSLALVIRFGYFGAVAGTAASVLIGSVLFVFLFGRKVIERPIRTMGGLLWKPLFNGAAASLAGILTRDWLTALVAGNSRVDVAASLFPAVFVFMIVYVALTIGTGAVTADDAGFARGAIPGRIMRLLEKRGSPRA